MYELGFGGTSNLFANLRSTQHLPYLLRLGAHFTRRLTTSWLARTLIAFRRPDIDKITFQKKVFTTSTSWSNRLTNS